MLYDEHGIERVRLGMNEKFSRPREWVARLEPTQDVEAIRIVRWFFESVAQQDRSVSSLAIELNNKGVASPRGGKWTATAAFGILRNPAYAGDMRYGSRAYGKYFQVGDDGELERSTRRGRKGMTPVVVRNAHPALIERQLFDQVQEILDRRSQRRAKPRRRGHLLTGLLTCGHCGNRLYVAWNGGKDGRRLKRYYQCKGRQTGVCRAFTIRADAIEKFLIGAVQKALLSPSAIAKVREQLEQTVPCQDSSPEDEIRSLEAQVAEFNKKIKKGAERLLLADESDVADLSAVLAEWRSRRDTLKAEIARTSLTTSSDPDALIEQALGKLTRLKEAIESVDAETARAAMMDVFESVTLWWRDTGIGRKREIDRGIAQFRTDGGIATLCGCSSSH